MAKALGVFLLPILISVMPVSARAASVEEFYKGKTIQFIVGGTAGGVRYLHQADRAPLPSIRSGQTLHCRAKYAGAAMLIAANYTYNSAPATAR